MILWSSVKVIGDFLLSFFGFVDIDVFFNKDWVWYKLIFVVWFFFGWKSVRRNLWWKCCVKILIGCFGVGDDVFCIMLFDDLIFKIVEGVEILFGIIVMIFNFFVGIGGFGFGFVFIFWIFVFFINVFVVLILRLFWFGIVC